MRNRNFNKRYKYGSVLARESQIFKKDIYRRIKLKDFFKGKKILDLGCGFGTDSIILAKFSKKVIGADILTYKEWKLFRGKNLKFTQEDCSKLTFTSNSFDGVYLKDLLHHITSVDKTLNEIKRVTKPGGYIVILEANRYNPLFFFYITKIAGHDHFTQAEFAKMINKKFPDNKIIHLEAYPPFFMKMSLYKYILSIEKLINKLDFLSPFFSYNIAVIKNQK